MFPEDVLSIGYFLLAASLYLDSEIVYEADCATYSNCFVREFSGPRFTLAKITDFSYVYRDSSNRFRNSNSTPML